ncbi:hypothetical protein ABH930_001233 [Kitasatospora sp. GAS204A]|nr:hypothetical protein [Kitasatospora sp. GAS204B]
MRNREFAVAAACRSDRARPATAPASVVSIPDGAPPVQVLPRLGAARRAG